MPTSTTGAPEAPPPTRARRAVAIDQRLLAYTSGTRRFVALTVAVGCLTALLVLAQSWLIASCVAGAVVDHKGLTPLRGALIALLCVVAARSVLSWLETRLADRASASAKSQLRAAFVAKLSELGPTRIEDERAGRLVVVATSGIDALDDYFARYVPQIFLAVLIPVAVVAVACSVDWISAVIIAVTVPLIPIFMALVGASTSSRMERQAALLQRLAGHFLDVVAGLPTLKVFGRAKAQIEAIREVTDRYRVATMSTLKVAFLSSLILELLATVSVALVAVAVGLRLLGGHISFETALFVLILAPQAYLPLRELGARYHASAEGLQAADELFDVLAEPTAPRGTRRVVPDLSSCAVHVEDLTVRYPGRASPALEGVSIDLVPGEVVAVAGPSGSGKSTLLSVLLGFTPPWTGSVRVGDVPLPSLDPDAWRAELAWVPQRPHLFAASIADNVRLGAPAATDDELAAAIAAAGLDEVIARLPLGAATRLGEAGRGLSAGERQRVALARAFLRDAALVLLDEPTANLDGVTEASVLAAIRRLTVGRMVLVAAHRTSLLSVADRVVTLPLRDGAPR